MRNCPANPASSFGPVWKLPREGAQWRGKLLRVLPNTVGFARLVKLSFFMAATIYFKIFEQNVVFVYAKCVTKLAQGRRCLWPDRDIAMPGHHVPWPDRNTKLAGPPCLWPDRDFNFAGPPCLWSDKNIKFAGPRCLWPDRYIKFAGPPCLWPDRETNLRAPRRTSLPMAGPATRFGTYKVTEWREGAQPQKTWIQKRIWKPRSSRFSSPTSIVCQGLVQTGLALHPMSRNRWSLEISSLKMFRLQCGLFLTQDVSPAVWGWHLLNARCFACSFGMAPSCLPFEHCNINFSCHSNIALWSAIL